MCEGDCGRVTVCVCEGDWEYDSGRMTCVCDYGSVSVCEGDSGTVTV